MSGRRLVTMLAWLTLMGLAAPTGITVGSTVVPPPSTPPTTGDLPPEAPAEAPPLEQEAPLASPPAPEEPATSPAQASPSDADAGPSETSPARVPAAEDEAPPTDPELEPRRLSRTPTAVAAASGTVAMSDFAFSPSSITIGVGDSVTWRNDGPSQHTGTGGGGSFDTGLVRAGQSGSASFDDAGSFSYVCTLHPEMTGTVRVVAQASADDGLESGSEADPAPGGVPDAADTGATLPQTGAEIAWLAITGLGLLVIGLAGRRRTRRYGG